MTRAYFIAAMAAILFAAQPAKAWGPDGHKIVCYLAIELLPAATRNKIEDLTTQFSFEGAGFSYYSAACNYPDHVRGKVKSFRRTGKAKYKPWADRYAAFDKWHYINLTRDDLAVDRGDCPKKQGCVVKAVRYHRALAKKSTGNNLADALFFLGHWVGDIHQPLHVSFKGDFGGNKYDDVTGNYGTGKRLHGIWDGNILKTDIKASGAADWRAYADGLLKTIRKDRKKYSGGTALVWANESYALARSKSVRYCKVQGNSCARIGGQKLGPAYQKANAPIVRQRLMQAGVRLSAILTKTIIK